MRKLFLFGLLALVSALSLSLNTSKALDFSGQRPQGLGLLRLPNEIFNEIASYWGVLPPSYYSFTYSGSYLTLTPSLEYAERTLALRALSQTCRGLREMCMPFLWRRLETCWVPKHQHDDRFQYIMTELRRKTDGILKANESIRAHVR